MIIEKILTRNFHLPNLTNLKVYEQQNGYGAIRHALNQKPDEIINIVKSSGLRGRGGAGFPTGMKWGFIKKLPGQVVYLCCNADEGEPGTCKDRFLMLNDPHALIEGMLIGAYALGAKQGFIYLRGEHIDVYNILLKAIHDATASGYLGKNIMGLGFDFDLQVQLGGGAYICGEETALINSLEGKRGEPRIKPPFPAVRGAWESPTIVNNVETFCAVPWIITHGGEAYSAIGTKDSKGTKLFSISGAVTRPGNYELPLGTPFDVLLNHEAQGVRDGHQLKAIIPGGASTPVMTAAECEFLYLSYEGLTEKGSSLGSGAVIVFDETQDMVEVCRILLAFYAHESCGQCPPCREGTYWLWQIVERISRGEGRADDLDLALSLCPQMKGTTICPLCDSAAIVIENFIAKFRGEFEAKIK